jgi:hypothetical protein
MEITEVTAADGSRRAAIPLPNVFDSDGTEGLVETAVQVVAPERDHLAAARRQQQDAATAAETAKATLTGLEKARHQLPYTTFGADLTRRQTEADQDISAARTAVRESGERVKRAAADVTDAEQRLAEAIVQAVRAEAGRRSADMNAKAEKLRAALAKQIGDKLYTLAELRANGSAMQDTDLIAKLNRQACRTLGVAVPVPPTPAKAEPEEEDPFLQPTDREIFMRNVALGR